MKATVTMVARKEPCRWWQHVTVVVGRTTYDASFVTDDEGIEPETIAIDRARSTPGRARADVSPHILSAIRAAICALDFDKHGNLTTTNKWRSTA